ncbi:hypothetical protein WA588_004333 [Blastocystis sp. NMH]
MDQTEATTKRSADETTMERETPEPKVRRCVRKLNCATEKEVGIDAFVSSEKGIRGVLKDSCEDFIVQEIDENGAVVDLVDTSEPKLLTKTIEKIPEEEGWKLLREVFSEEVCNKIQEFKEKVQQDENTQEGCTLTAIDDKGKRKQVHDIIKRAFPMFTSDTTDDCVVLYSYKNQNKYHTVHREVWPDASKNYVAFTVKKRGQETMTVVSNLAHAVHRAPKMFSYYGTKDKRAITFQRVVAYRITPHEIYEAAKKVRDIEVGDFAFVAEPATIGGNRGNRFTVTLRGLKTSNPEDSATTLRERLMRVVESLQSVGYVNYYGLQRFGNGGLNVEVGACMLRSEWKEAVMGILNSNHSNGNVMQKAIKKWEETQSGAEAAKVLPKFMHSEAQLFRALDKSGGKGFSNALASLPFNRRTLYIHAVQSLLFNRFASRRVVLGLQPIPGDLVCKMEAATELTDKTPLTVVTEENRAQFDIHQVVLPLPGMSTQIPVYLQSLYESLMGELGLKLDCWSQAIRDYRMHGSYRHLLSKPADVEGELVDEDSMRLAFSLGSAWGAG